MKKYLLNYGKTISAKAQEFEVFDASLICGEGGNLPVHQNYHLDKFGFPLSEEEILTFRAHISLWETFASSDESVCLIVEDNVDLSDDQLANFEECVSNIPSDWDIFFPYEPNRSGNRFDQVEVLNPTWHEKEDYQPYLLGQEWGNSIYAITRAGVRRLLDEIKAIKLRLDDTILELAVDKNATVLFAKVDFFDLNRFPKRKYVQREKLIVGAVSNFNVWTMEDENELRLLLKAISDIAKKTQIQLILQGGTHLGYVRHGGKMPWDDDVDLGINEADFPRLEKMLKGSSIKYDRVIEGSTGVEFYKLWLDNRKKINGYSYCFPFVDLWLFNMVGDDLVFKNGIICPNSAIYPYKKVNFEGAEFWLVGNSLEVLDSRYKDWRTKVRIYNWNHREENGNRFRLQANICVDEHGKLLNFIQNE